jgi:diacylglycerol kinase family enzyme
VKHHPWPIGDHDRVTDQPGAGTIFPDTTGTLPTASGAVAVIPDTGRYAVLPGTGRIRARRWLARLSLLLAAAAAAVLLVFGERRSIGLLAAGLISVVVSLAAAYWFLAGRGLRRWISLAVVFLSPVAALIAFGLAGLLWVAIASAGAWFLAALAARAALAPDPAAWVMPAAPVRTPAARPFLIMNPRSGGGKVDRFDLRHKAERLGAEVFLMDGPADIDVAAVARRAVGKGADLLGVAGGDGTQALVADVAAEHEIPFVVITAGTRNHFALDLGLDRDDPAACLGALTDGEDIRVDLGTVGTTTFVNNASFGAYAEVVQSPAYRGDKLRATLDQLPELITGQRGAMLCVRTGAGDGEAEGRRPTLERPQAVLVANNPYGTGDIAGLGRRARLDTGMLEVVGVHVGSAGQAVRLLRGSRSGGLGARLVAEVTVDADAPEIPVGIDGEAVVMTTPVRCSIRPAALTVRVPRERPGVPVPRARMNWAQLCRLAAPAVRSWRSGAAA